MKEKINSKKKKIIVTSIYSILTILLVIVMIIGTNTMNFYENSMTLYFGEIGGGLDTSKVEKDENGNFVDSNGNIIDTEYFKIDQDYYTDGAFDNVKFKVAQEELCIREVSEGTVLLKNAALPAGGKALPLAKNSKVSVFGLTSTWWMTREYFGRDSRGDAFYNALEGAGINYNPALAQYYMQSTHTKWGVNAFNLGDGAQKGNMSLDEVPWDEIDARNSSSSLGFDNYKDAAVVIFSRAASEGGDAPRHMSKFNDGGGEQFTDEYHYLQLTPREKGVLEGIKGKGFINTVVILHTGNPMEMTEIDMSEYGVTACLWVAGTGEVGVKAVGGILAGDYNPSAKLVDTFCYDNFSAPAMQNYGDFRFRRNGSRIDYSYMNYAEGIYVGYKYYETRYEDIVLGRTNAGSFNYSEVVARPFGFGMSYTDFSWSEYSVSDPDENGEITVSVKVTNDGSYAGKDVVQIYYQAPYSFGGVEKASVNLLGYAKTRSLTAVSGSTKDSQTVSVTFNIDDMKSYDEITEKTYVLDSGDYYITAASDAHKAINNILAKKGHTKASKPLMTENGDGGLVDIYNVSANKKVSTAAGDLEVTNQFREFSYLSGATYLSRSNWSVMEAASPVSGKGIGGLTHALASQTGQSNVSDSAGTVYLHDVSETVYEGLTAKNWEASGNPKGIDDYDAVETGKDYGHQLSDLMGSDYDDKRWDELIAQIGIDEMASVYCNAGYGTAIISAIGKPLTLEMDGPQGLVAYSGSPLGSWGFRYPVQVVLGATWSDEVIKDFGAIYAQECLTAALDVTSVAGADGLWAPGVNIHRSPFSGRNWEYFGECGTLTGLMAHTQVTEMNSRGVKMQLKHFFLNDQETNRSAYGEVAVFSNEQAIREIYLKAFQKSIESGKSGGVMCSENRIGYRFSYACYSSLTNVLRGEWDMHGCVITDFANLDEEHTVAALAGGCDMIDGTGQLGTAVKQKAGVQAMLSQSLKNICWNTVNSLAMNGMAPGVVPVAGFPVYKLLLIVLWVFVCIYILYGAWEVVLCYIGDKLNLSKKARWIPRWIAIGVAVAFIVTVTILFFSLWFEDLLFALQM